MSQESVLSFLKKHKGVKYSAKQLCFIFDVTGSGSIYPNLKKIRDQIEKGSVIGFKFDLHDYKGKGKSVCFRYWYDG